MLEVHRELDERYRALRDSRNGPVFFIEHGLSEEAVASVVADVSHSLDAHPFESPWWNSHSLPLIVAATEVGYRYRGTGTDFWPALEDKLGLQISASNRQRIRDLFASASIIYRGAKPAVTPWAKAFRLIAWPITHALAPLEIHRPLVLTLANVRENIAELTDDDLYRVLRLTSSNSSARFVTLLEDAALIVAVTRNLLGDGNGELCSKTMARIAEDLNSDQITRRGVAVARQIQRTAAEQAVPPTSSTVLLPSIEGVLQLRRRDSAITLEAVFPTMQADLLSRLRRALRRRRYVASLWDVSARVPSEQLLAGLPFTLKLTSVPPEEAELLPGLDEVDIEPELRDVLTAFTLDIAPPLLFAVSSDEELGRRVKGPVISGHRKYWLLSEPTLGPENCPAFGEVGPYSCHLLDPAADSDRDKLGCLGFQVRFGTSVGFVGAPPLNRDASVPAFAVGDRRILVPRRPPPEGLSVQLGEERVQVTDSEVVSVVVERGDHLLKVSNNEEKDEFVFQGVSPPQPVLPATCSIETHSDDLTIQAFLRGELNFAIDSYAPLEGLELVAEIEVSSLKFFATARLGPLPCLVSSNMEPFATLLDDKIRGLLAQVPSLTLRLSVGLLCTRSLVLEQRVRSCWWQQSTDGKLALTNEIGELSFGGISATDPTAPPKEGFQDSLDEVQLLAPTNLDVSEHGGSAPFTTFCIAPTRVQLDTPAIKKPNLARRRRAGDGALGLEDLVEAYLRWSLAESTTLIAEMRRRQVAEVLDAWFVELCCGERWACNEQSFLKWDHWAWFQDIFEKRKLYHDSYVPLSRDQQQEISRFAISEIRDQLPNLWDQIAPYSDLCDKDCELLNESISRAYDRLKKANPKLEEPDIWHDKYVWGETLNLVVDECVGMLSVAAMLLPTNSANSFMTLESSRITLDELTEELTVWAQRERRTIAGSVPSAAILKAILALWVEPETAVGLDWRGALDVLLVERSVARAARYLALRSREASLHGGAQSG